MAHKPWYEEPEIDPDVLDETWTVEKHLMNAMQLVSDVHRHLDTALYKKRREYHEWERIYKK